MKKLTLLIAATAITVCCYSQVDSMLKKKNPPKTYDIKKDTTHQYRKKDSTHIDYDEWKNTYDGRQKDQDSLRKNEIKGVRNKL